LSRALLADATLRQQLDLTPEEEQIIAIEPGYIAPDASGQLDAFLNSYGDFSFVEYHADSPLGLLYGDLLSEIFMEMEVMREFSRKFTVRPIAIKPRILDTLLDCYGQWAHWNSREHPHIAIVIWKGVESESEYEICRHYFESRGYPAIIVDPNELEYRGGWLRVRDFRINIVYKRVTTSDLLKEVGINHALVRAARDRAACVVNSFRVQMLYKKAIFALLDDPIYDHLFTTEEIGALCRHIPWTRRLRRGFASYRGRHIDLMEFVLSHRNVLLLKPNSNGNGVGAVIRGWQCNDEDWQRSVRDAVDTSFIVQERVDGMREPFPMLVNGDIQYDDRFVNFDPYTWGGEEVEGAGVKLSPSSLLNGGSGNRSVAPMLIIEET